jgi:hypothetical protein
MDDIHSDICGGSPVKFKQQLKKIIIIVVIGIAFLIIMNYFQKQEEIIEVSPDKFTIVDSEKELDKKFGELIPGYSLANQYNLLKEYNIELPIIKENRTLRIEKAWLFRDNLFIIYSFNLKQDDDEPENIPTIQIKSLTVETSDGDNQTLTVPNAYKPADFKAMETGYVFNNRIYKGEVIHPNAFIDTLVQKLSSGIEITKINLNKPILKSEKAPDIEVTLKDLNLDYQFNLEESQTLKKVNVNQKSKLANGDILHWHEFHVGLEGNRLYYSVEPADAKIRRVDFKIDFPEGVKVPEEYSYFNGTYPITYDNSGKSYFYIPSFEEFPEALTLNLTGVEYVGKERVQFTIPKDEIDLYFNKKNYNANIKEVGKTKDYIFMYGGLSQIEINNQRAMGLKIGISRNDNQNVMDMYFMSNNQYEENLKRAEEDPDNPYYKYWANLSGPILKITNGNKQLSLDPNVYNYEQKDSTFYQTFLLDQKLISPEEELKVEIFNIPKYLKFTDKNQVKRKLK